MSNRVLRLLNVRSDESWLVTNLFWLQFFQGVGVAIFNTVALALFLKNFDVLELPKVYIFSAVLLLIAGFLYSKVEHALPINKLVPGVILFVGFSILLFRIEYSVTINRWFLFTMFSWYYVIYLLTNLEFWGLASLQFDIRQSKRLFGMIGAGDIPAKLIGYSAVPALVQFFNSGNMLVISALCILASLFFYFRLSRSGKLEFKVKHDHTHKKDQVTENWLGLLKSFFGNRLIAYVAFLSFLVLSVVTIVSYSFYSEIKHEAHSDLQLASFIAIFMASGRVVAIIIRLIFTGRLTSILGTKGTLLVSPVILFVFLSIIIFLPHITHIPHIILYSFGLMYILTEVLKTSLQDPVFLSLMQPLSSSLRLKGHTIVKGVMDPFAYGFSGFMLFGLVKFSGDVDLYQLSYMLFTLLIVWVIMIFVVDREYVKTLVTALHKRYSVGTEIDLNNEQTRNVLLSKMGDSERGEAIYILHLIEKNYTDEQEELVLKALQHSKTEVKLEALKLAERRKVMAALPAIEAIISTGAEEPEILSEAVKAKCMLESDELDKLDVYLETQDLRLMKAAITGLMTSGSINAVVTAGQRLLQLIPSTNEQERKIAAEIIGDLGVQSFYKPLLGLLQDTDKEVVKAAIIASSKVKNEKLVAPLMHFFTQRRHERLVSDALQKAGDVSLKEIRHVLLNHSLSRQQQARLIFITGRIGTEKAAKVLDELVWKLPYLRSDIFHALHLCDFQSLPHSREQHVALMNQYLISATHLLFSIQELEKTKTAGILADALHLELKEIRDSLLLLFSFVYHKEKMMKAKSAFQLNKRESVATALEVIEIEVPKEISLKFIKIFEPGPVADKCTALKIYFKELLSYEKIVDTILSDHQHHFHRWTKAAALHSAIYYTGPAKRRWLDKAEKETDILLRETAEKILVELN